MELLSMHEQGPRAEAMLPDLTEYYLEKRMRYKLTFLEPQIRRNKWQDNLTARWPFWFFFASVFLSMLLFAWNLLSSFTGVVEIESRVAPWIIFLAAGLPVMSAGVATWRAAHQFARNMKRYQECHHALTQLRNHLQKPTPAVIRFRDFLACESKLEAEHRNWLHLMTDAEWF